MPRLQIRLPEEDLAALREWAKREGVPTAELLRRAVKRVLETRGLSRRELLARTLDAAGCGHSGRSDIAERHDDYLAEAYKHSHEPK